MAHRDGSFRTRTTIGLEPVMSRDRAVKRNWLLGSHAGVATLAFAVSLTLFGCGATTHAAVVASVQGGAVHRTTLEHWTRVTRAEHQVSATSPPTPTAVQRQALAFLITAKWLELEATAQGISVSPAAVRATYQQLLSGLAGPAFANSLKRRGISTADELFQLRLSQLSVKLRAKIVAGYRSVSANLVAGYYRAHPGQFRRQRQTLKAATPTIRQILLEAERRQHLDAFTAAFRQRWKQRTTCEPGS
jgi:hypothetical protein